MTDRIDRKLEEMGLSLPAAAAPVASYVPTVDAGGLLHISGQLPFKDGKVVTGKLGDGVDKVAGQEAAELCGLMLVAQIKAALGGDLSRVERIVKLGVFVNSAPDFTDQPEVANGASNLMEALFGDAGKHARSAVGVAALPRGAAVEVDAVVKLHATI
ncbi:MAG: RidA family protein [Sphingomonas sp.]|uniref:RidA family protein n=1 Tax=Sphingomonas sp. TaxID=28214 RepID=UPI001AD5CA63|nr:RidA family protein [Sphingomonas sp.]MBN8809193.1 RidA family protein [Sphingomonas sp.]